MPSSPYTGLESKDWAAKTKSLVKKHPLPTDEIVEVVRGEWNSIFDSRIGSRGFRIGADILPKPQIMGFLLHELIPLELAARYPKEWRGERVKADKDLVYIPDNAFSVEIKTSSHKSQIFGNRSYAQAAVGDQKSKSGYYLAINFHKFGHKKGERPEICKIRFGWIDHEDWRGQTAATGQQANLPPEVDRGKLLPLYSAE